MKKQLTKPKSIGVPGTSTGSHWPLYEATTLASLRRRYTLPSVLILTATEIETTALHSEMSPLRGRQAILKISDQCRTYFVGMLGVHAIVHVQCQMGSVQQAGSSLTTYETVSVWDCRAVVMVGIAFGINKKSQKIGDVLISRAVIPYDVKREGSKKTVHRGLTVPSGRILFDRFTNCPDWKFGQRESVALIPGDILSGESLIDNLRMRRRLSQVFPTAVGGDMEGIGLCSAASAKNIEWLLVKAICDFADGKKSYKKKERQRIAAQSAASLAKHVFSAEGALAPLELTKFPETVPKPESLGPRSSDSPKPLGQPDALFEVLTPQDLSVAHVREIDIVFCRLATIRNIWLWGPSGSGKSTSVRIFLFSQNQPFQTIDLSPAIGRAPNAVFSIFAQELLERIESRSRTETGDLGPLNPKTLAQRVAVCTPQEPSIIFIDEIPLEGEELSDFAILIYDFLTRLINLAPEKHVRMIVAAHEKIKSRERSVQQRLRERFSPLEHPLWTSSDLGVLCSIIGTQHTYVSKSEYMAMVDAASSSPRLLKQIARSWIALRGQHTYSLKDIIRETLVSSRP